MSTRFAYDQLLTAPPAAVMRMLLDPEYVREKCERTGGHDVTVSREETPEGRVRITSTRSMPAAVPSYAQAFVGDTLTVTEVQEWEPPGADGSARATVEVDFHAPMTYTGTIALSGTDGGSTLRNEGEFIARVPFVGGKVEGVAREQTERYLAKETLVAEDWLAR